MNGPDTAQASEVDLGEGRAQSSWARRIESNAQTAGAKRAYGWASAIGAVPAACVFVWLLFTDPQRGSYEDFFYDFQAHSLLHGHWDVSRGSLQLEGFLVHGRTYEYFGPFPALLRLPIAALTTRFDGRLSTISMLVAFATLMFFTARLAARLRPLVLGTEDVSIVELGALAAFTFVVGAGSIVVFLASHLWVYHEAALWGLALALGAFEFVIAFTLEPTRKHVVVASALTAASLLSRGVIGLGPLLALAITCSLVLARDNQPEETNNERPSRGAFRALCVGAALAPVALYCAVNYAKFGTLLSVPWGQQLSATLPESVATLSRNSGTWIGLRFVPETLTQYLRPDAIRPSAAFPWWQFRHTPHIVARYDYTSSLTVTMPAFVVLAIVGTVGAFRRKDRARSRLAVLRASIVGAGIATLATLSFGSIANRYLADFFPGLVVASIAGLLLMLRWSRTANRRASVSAWTVVALLAVFGTWTSLALTIVYEYRKLPLHP